MSPEIAPLVGRVRDPALAGLSARKASVQPGAIPRTHECGRGKLLERANQMSLPLPSAFAMPPTGQALRSAFSTTAESSRFTGRNRHQITTLGVSCGGVKHMLRSTALFGVC
jgi:hypothetical protein